MKTFIEVLLRMSAYGSIAVLLVIVLRALFRKFPKKATVLFWLVAAVRLVCPVNFETPLSLFNLAPQSVIDNLESTSETGAAETATTSANDLDTVLKALSDAGILSQTGAGNNTGNSPYDVPENGTVSAHETTSADPFQSDHDAVSSLIFIIWGVGVAGILAYVVISAKRANLTISRFFRHKGEFLESDEIRTPFVFGIFSPKICVPSSIDVNEKDYMLLHEQIHIKNHDALIKAIALAVLCLHWFNPLVWVAFRLLLNDLEMRCDEEVVDILGDKIRKEYCLSIVNHAKEDDSFRVFTTAFAKKSLGRMEIKMRIKNLINYKKVSKLTTLIVLITVLTATFVLTSCATTDAPEVPATGATSEAGESSSILTTDNNAGTEVHTIRVNSDGTTFKDSVLVTLPDGTKINMVKVSKDDISDVHSVKIEGVPEDTETVNITSDNSTLEFAEDDYTVGYEVNDDWKGGVTITSKDGSVEEGMVSIASEVDSDDYSESTYVYE
ncbi:MAG: M56 family metallopeptidase, partial [Lachnospiraceae bacterium]|nr:M56 family metallopeptidase [Lachnospiraceae bacterium]